jgi:hypothetical protein
VTMTQDVVTLLVKSKSRGKAVLHTTVESQGGHGVLLVTRIPKALKIGRRDLTNRVSHGQVCQAEPKTPPDRVADDLGREAMILVRVGCRCCFHAASMPHRTALV